MKVLLASDWFLPRVGGIELHVRDLGGELIREGHEVHVLTTTPADPRRQGRLQARTIQTPEGVVVHRLDVPLLPGAGLGLSLRLPDLAARALEAVAPDVVHVHAGVVPPLALATGAAADARGIPVVVTFHSVLGPVRHAWRLSDAVLGWSRWATVLAGVGRGVADEMEGVTGRRVRVLSNGIHADAWTAPDDDPTDGEHAGLRLVTVMRLQRRKRGRALLDVVAGAARRLGSEHPVSLTVVGDGPRRPALARHARRLGVEDRVRFTGYRSRTELPAILAGADVFVTTSVLESFGLSALEARAAGLPVVARADSGVATHVRHGVEGLLGTSDGEIEDHLVRLGRDRPLLEAMRGHNRETRPPCDWSVVTAAHLDAYDDAMAAMAAMAPEAPVTAAAPEEAGAPARGGER